MIRIWGPRAPSGDLRDLIVPVLCGALLLQTAGVAEAAVLMSEPAAPAAVETSPTAQRPESPEETVEPPREDEPGERLREVWERFRESLTGRGDEPQEAEGGAAEPARGEEAAEPPVYGPDERPPTPPFDIRAASGSATIEEGDESGGSSSASTSTSTSAPPPSETPLLPGANLVSIPNPPTDPDPAAVLAPIAGQYDAVFAYDACDAADPWKLYDPADPASSDLSSIDHKLGLWVDATAATALPSPGSQPAVTEIELCTGWNLIGYPLGQPRPVAAALASIAGQYARVFGFDVGAPPDEWEVYDVAAPWWANDLTAMRPGRGYWVLATEDTTLDYTNAGAPPEVEILTPAARAEVASITEVVGTVQSALLDRWTLSYRPSGTGDPFVPFATGDVPVAAGPLGDFDPSLLLNGPYDLKLEALDFQGQIVETVIPVAVDGGLKIGLFTLSFSDLQVPLSGLDIEIVRTYDSRDKRQGDFGIGWTLDVKQGSYVNNVVPGEGWEIVSSEPPSPFPCVAGVETQPHLTTIRLSDQEVYRFRAEVFDTGPNLGGCLGKVRFAYVDGPVPGASLDILGNTDVLWGTGTDFLFDALATEPYNPRDVRLTTRDGRQFDLTLDDGVTAARDTNGNELEITPTAISHSSGVSIAIERDALGRVTAITDPGGGRRTYAYDASGDLVAATDAGGNTTTFAYDVEHGLVDIVDPLGNGAVRNDYDEAGRLIATTDAAGNTIRFDRDVTARREVVTNRLGHTRVLEYDERGNVTREIDELGKETLRTFDGDDNLLSETDPLGRTTSYGYSAAGDVETLTDPLGNTTSFTYDAAGRMLTITSPRSHTASNVYDAAGNLTQTTDALGHATAFTYDARGNVLTETDALGGLTTSTYDAQGNLTSQTDPLGNVTTHTYDANGNQLTETRTRTIPGEGGSPPTAETLTTTFVYDELDRVVSTTAPDGSTTSQVYDALGRVVSRTDALGRVTAMEYDGRGRLTTTTFPDTTTESTTYDAEGRTLARIDRAGRVTSFSYDPAGRLLTTTYPDGAGAANGYDDAGQLVSRTDERSHTTTFAYDAAGRRSQVVDALGQTTTMAYDTAGNQVSITDARGNVTQIAYDELNRRTVTTLADGETMVAGYDALGRRITETDQAGRTTTFGYDALGRLTSVTDALGQITSYTYDEVGNRLTQTDANGNTTSFGYDAVGRQTSRTFPDGASESMAYHPDGNVASRTDFLGRPTTFGYDVNGRLASRSHPDGTSVAWSWTPTGQRQSYADSRGTTSFTYDERDRVTSMVTPDGRRLDYAYDAAGNRTGLAATVGATVLGTTYTYDPLNRLATVTDPSGGVYAHAYDSVGNRASLSYPNGVTTSTLYDPVNRLSLLATAAGGGTTIQSYAFTLDETGRRERIDEHDGTARSYTYDALYRLTRDRVTDAAAALVYEEEFAYDPVGNRLSLTRDDGSGPAVTAYGYDSRDRLLTEGATAYTWDANGNLTAKTGIAAYGWDTQDRLTTATLADGTEVVTHYDPDGNRVRTETTPPDGPTETVDYLVDTSGFLSHVVAESDGAGNVLTHYTRGDELLSLYRPTAGERKYFHADGIGSVRVLTDVGGAVTDRYAYTAFGVLEEHAGSDPQPYRFTAEPLDPNTGFQYHRARWLDTGVGRFASVDAFEGRPFDPVTLHRYLYANAAPVSLVDPSGEFSIPSLSVNLAVRAVLQSMVYGFVFGALLGGADAALRGDDILEGAALGGLVGLTFGPLIKIRFVGTVLSLGGFGAGLLGTIDAIEQNNYALAVFRGALSLTGAVAFFKSAPPVTVSRGPGGRLGKRATRDEIRVVGDILENRGWKVTGGGGRLPEEYLPGPGGGRKGSNWVDITAEKNGRVLRINTVDTRADGITPTTREAAAAALIRSKTPQDHLLLLPKHGLWRPF